MAVTVGFLFLTGCMRPADEQLATVEVVASLNTIGYCRDIVVQDTLAFVAADQAGVEVWNLGHFAGGLRPPEMLLRVDSLAPAKQFENAVRVDYSPLNHRLFAAEISSKVFPMTLESLDSVTVDLETMSLYTEDFLVLDAETPGIPDSVYVLLAADRDDGLKIESYRYQNFFGVWGWYQSTDFISHEVASLGRPYAVAYQEGKIAMAIGQAGVSLYDLDMSTGNVRELDTEDTPYTAKDVVFYGNLLYVATDDGGISIFRVEDSGLTLLGEVGEQLGVESLALNGRWLVGSLQSNGIAVFSLSVPERPRERGIFDIGYTYRCAFSDAFLLAATREGLKILRLSE
ncbi:MAG: hypothetical protein D6762_00735 [Candidatus Neomarinimicrobiota bacterium]|nr:MAG: hypothetical protein D6762_00735 [Candidatus Neomarinimicrobiota bacterium]